MAFEKLISEFRSNWVRNKQKVLALMKNEYSIVTCADSRMLPAACCVLFWAHKNSNLKPRLYVLANDLNDSTRVNFETFCAVNACQITLIEYEPPQVKNHDLQRFRLASTSRLHLDLALPADVKRVLYLDCDIFIAGNIDELLKMNMHGMPLAAVQDVSKHGPNKVIERSAVLGLPTGVTYFTSAILLFDLPIARNKKILESSRQALLSRHNFQFPDQDAMNIGAAGNYVPIPIHWNLEPFLWNILGREKMLHFSGKIKPWHNNAPFQVQEYRNRFKVLLEGTGWDTWVACNNPIRHFPFRLYSSIRFWYSTRRKQNGALLGYGRVKLLEMCKWSMPHSKKIHNRK